jgi:hypothetical protein
MTTYYKLTASASKGKELDFISIALKAMETLGEKLNDE